MCNMLTMPTVLTLMVALPAPAERDTQEMELFVLVRWVDVFSEYIQCLMATYSSFIGML